MKRIIKKLSLVISVVVITCAIQACTDGKSEVRTIPAGGESIPVKVTQLHHSAELTMVTASGQVTTEDETLLAFKTSGVVEQVYVREGDRVRKGQLLATLNLTEIDALVAQASYAYEKEERDYQRVTSLYRDSVATLEQLQNLRTSVAVAKERLEAAKFNRTFSEIHAPAAGYVLRKFVSPGRVVNVGEPILLTNSAAGDNWLLRVGVSDREWASIRMGDTAKVQIDAFTGQKFRARVSRKAEAADPLTGAFTIELQLRNDGLRLATGMFGTSVIACQQSRSVWNVPYEAVLDANGHEGFVFVTKDNKVAVRKPVTIAAFDGTSMQISGGIENSDVLIVSGSAYLTDQSPIKIID
jgi:RND family efflux transporter MFP subunit